MKKVLIHIRTWIKLICLTVLAAILIVGGVAFIYQPTYSVTLNGEFIGYTKDKSKLQSRINEYIESGNGENIAFVQVDNLPEYSLCLLKKNIETNDEEIFHQVADSGTTYYRYYAVVEDEEEKAYVASFQEAEEIVNGLKDKNSKNKDAVSIEEKYELEQKEIISSEDAISKLYEKVEEKKVTPKVASAKVASTSMNTGNKVSLAVNLIRPVSGSVTSRFGVRWGKGHK